MTRKINKYISHLLAGGDLVYFWRRLFELLASYWRRLGVFSSHISSFELLASFRPFVPELPCIIQPDRDLSLESVASISQFTSHSGLCNKKSDTDRFNRVRSSRITNILKDQRRLIMVLKGIQIRGTATNKLDMYIESDQTESQTSSDQKMRSPYLLRIFC